MPPSLSHTTHKNTKKTLPFILILVSFRIKRFFPSFVALPFVYCSHNYWWCCKEKRTLNTLESSSYVYRRKANLMQISYFSFSFDWEDDKHSIPAFFYSNSTFRDLNFLNEFSKITLLKRLDKFFLENFISFYFLNFC